MSTPDAPDRFNEEKQTYTVRGVDQPDLEGGVAAIRNVLKTLPTGPASTACTTRAAMCSMWARRAC
jgi:hypothetical protein